MIEFIIRWGISYILIMTAMSIDNLTWIPADYNWYGNNKWRPYFKVLFIIRGKEYLFPNTKEGWEIVRGRVKDVLTHQYDIVPGLITSLILTLVTYLF